MELPRWRRSMVAWLRTGGERCGSYLRCEYR